MRKIVLTLLLAAAALAAQEIHWEKDFSSAVAKAEETHKPLFFVFSNHGCKWCVHLERTTFKDPRVVERLNSNFVNVIAFTDDNDYVPQELWLPGTPALWFLEGSGEPMFQPIQGAIGADDLLKATEIVLKEHQKNVLKQRYGK